MTAPAADFRLSFFVDRDEEMARFQELLRGGRKKVLTVQGSEGLGKSLLMERMVHECSLRGLRTSKVILRENRTDALYIMRTIRDDLGATSFDNFTALVSVATTGSPGLTVNVSANAPIIVGEGVQQKDNSQIGTMAAVNINVHRDLMVERLDIVRRESERLAQITDAFLEGVRAAVGKELTIVFIDDCQKMSSETERWLCDELLFSIKHDKLSNTLFVLLSRTEPDLASYNEMAQRTSLKPLSRDHVKRYLEIRNIPEGDRAGLLTVIWSLTQGTIAPITHIVEAYEQEKARENEQRTS